MTLEDIKIEFNEVIKILAESVSPDGAPYGEQGEEVVHAVTTCIEILEIVLEEIQ